MPKKIEVEIFNQIFNISSATLSEEELKNLAQFVDSKMKETFYATNLSSALKVAVLTALNFAEEIKSSSPNKTHQNHLELAEQLVQLSQRIDKMTDSIKDLTND